MRGIGENTLPALYQGGYTSVEKINAEEDVQKLADSTGIGVKKARQLKHWVKVYLGEIDAVDARAERRRRAAATEARGAASAEPMPIAHLRRLSADRRASATWCGWCEPSGTGEDRSTSDDCRGAAPTLHRQRACVEQAVQRGGLARAFRRKTQPLESSSCEQLSAGTDEEDEEREHEQR